MVVFCSLLFDCSTQPHPFGLSLSKLGRPCPQSVRAEPVEAWACWLGRHAWFQGGGRESPGMRVTFFWRRKRKPLRRRAHTPASALGNGTRQDQRHGFDKLSPNGRGVAPRLRQAQPERKGCGAPASTSSARTHGALRPSFDKLSPNAWRAAPKLRQAQPERMGRGAQASTGSAQTVGVRRAGFDRLSPNRWGVAQRLRQAQLEWPAITIKKIAASAF